MAKKRLDNEFSWSYSRHSCFNECKKKYWYTYYGSWEGWPKTPYDTRNSICQLASKLYTLKQIQSLPMFIGSTVHKTIEHFINERMFSKKEIEKEEFLEVGRNFFLVGLQDAKNEKWKTSPKKHLNLFEYYYGSKDSLSEQKINESLDKISICLQNWIDSPISKMLFNERSEWISCEELDSFMLKKIYKVFVVIDFALLWKGKEDTLILFDWKTGEVTNKTDEQLLSYALYIKYKKPEFSKKLIVTPFYLFKNLYTKLGVNQENTITEEMLLDVENKIYESCEKMREKVSTLTIVAGTPPPDPRLFPYTENRKMCESCQFKEVCTKAQYQEISYEELKQEPKLVSIK